MEQKHAKQRIETEGIIIGYAMSRLDVQYLANTGVKSWRAAFQAAANALAIPPSSFKNLRDEFDPIHGNSRAGWRGREMRPNRQRVATEFSEVSDDALMEFVARILARDETAIQEAVDVLIPVTRVPANVAERLLTGRRAEDYFLANSESLVGLTRDQLNDCRILCKGYDFDSPKVDSRVFEVKGMKKQKGMVLFTDREWSTAKERQSSYWLVIVGNIETKPTAKVIQNPHSNLTAKCIWKQTISATWQSSISV